MTRYNPAPVVTINGVEPITGPGPDGPAGQIVLDDFSILWGRDELLEQPTPSTGRIFLFDATRTWATANDLRGRTVTVAFRGLVPNSTTEWEQVFFRGRIGQGIRVQPHTVQHGTRAITGALVELPVQSILLDLANTRPTVAWPEETLGARADRIAALVPGVLPGGIDIRDHWTTPNVWPVPADKQRSLLEHIEDLFDSSGADRYVFYPVEDVIYSLYRRNYGVRSLAYLDRIPTTTPEDDRAGLGVFARTVRFEQEGRTGSSVYIPAGEVEYEEGLVAPPRITRVQVTNPDGSDASKSPNFPTRTIERTVSRSDEQLYGVRTARLESIITWNNYVDTSADDLREIVSEEGGMWQLSDTVRFSTRTTGGFENLGQARLLLRGAESMSIIFLQGSWLPSYGVRPIFANIGGRIGYRQGGWEIEMKLMAVSTSSAQHGITWEEMDDGTEANTVRWWDDDQPDGMHASLTLDDLGYVGKGLGVADVPADTGWDSLVT